MSSVARLIRKAQPGLWRSNSAAPRRAASLMLGTITLLGISEHGQLCMSDDFLDVQDFLATLQGVGQVGEVILVALRGVHLRRLAKDLHVAVSLRLVHRLPFPGSEFLIHRCYSIGCFL